MNLARASSLIGSVTMLSYAFLLLMLDQSHLILLGASTSLILLSFWLSRFPNYQRFFSIHSMKELKLPGQAAIPPALTEKEAIFLLKSGEVVIYDLHSQEIQYSFALGLKWECAQPVIFGDLIGAWTKGQFVVISKKGKIISTLAVPLQGVSLSFMTDGKLYLGTTQEFLHSFCPSSKNWKSFPMAGVPLTWDSETKTLFTSFGSFYGLKEGEPELVCSSKGLPLGAITLPDAHFYFDMDQNIVRVNPHGEESLGFYHRDFFYPFKARDCFLYVDREYHLCRIAQSGEITKIFQFLSSPIWVRHTSHFLVIAMQRNAEVEVYAWFLGSDDYSAPICYQGSGSFMPLGMGDEDLFFSVRAELWYHWSLRDNQLVAMDGAAASQVLVSNGKILIHHEGKWMHTDKELTECELKVQEVNYEYQPSGFFPIS